MSKEPKYGINIKTEDWAILAIRKNPTGTFYPRFKHVASSWLVS